MRLLSHTLFRFIIGLRPAATLLVALFRHLRVLPEHRYASIAPICGSHEAPS